MDLNDIRQQINEIDEQIVIKTLGMSGNEYLTRMAEYILTGK